MLNKIPDDDPMAIPPFLRISVEERNAAWERKPPVAMPTAFNTGERVITDEGTLALMAQLKEQKTTRVKTSVAKSATRKEDRAAAKAGRRWDARRNRWVD